MRPKQLTRYAFVAAILLPIGWTANAATLSVNCGSKTGLHSIGAAIKALQSSEESHGPSTLNVSGACNENVVIQSIDRLTLNALNGASITDASSGARDVVLVNDSRDVVINNFTINGGDFGIRCNDGSLCRLNGNMIQGGAGGGALALGVSQIVVVGGSLQDTVTGLAVLNGSTGSAVAVTVQNNSSVGIEVSFHSFMQTDATVTNNANTGVFLRANGTLHCNGCSVTGNPGGGVLLRRDSSAMFENGFAITGNGGPGVSITEVSTAQFVAPGTVTGNGGGTDVMCEATFTVARGATTNIGGGNTNCVEPPL
jgi:hypothetical protein